MAVKLVPIYRKAIKNVRWLNDDIRCAFFQRIVLLMIHCINDPTKNIVPELYQHVNIKDRRKIIETLGHLLMNMGGEDKKGLWTKWLKKY